MARLLLMLLVNILITNNASAESWIALNGKATKLSKSTKCGNFPEEACDCCLLKNTMVQKMTNQKALDACTDKGFCQNGIRGANEGVREARKRMSPFEIINIEKLAEAPKLPQNGMLNADSVLDILVSLSHNGSLPLVRRILQSSHKPCLKIKALGNGAKGVHTGQLFAIQVNQACVNNNSSTRDSNWRNLYILKESKKGFSELHNLYRVKVSQLGNEYIETARTLYDENENPHSPTALITFDDLHFKIVAHNKTRYFSLLQTAKGKSFQDQLVDFSEQLADTSLSIESYIAEISKAKTMFYRIGFALSKLHQKYAQSSKNKETKLGKTYIHGDFHAQNVFYDHRSTDVTLIDNETFSLALKKRTSGVNDIVDLYLLHTVRTVAHQVSKQLKTNREMGISDILWHDLWHYFFVGYLQAYEFATQKDLQNAFFEFRAKFYECLSNAQLFDSIKNFKDQRVLKRFGPSFRRFYVREHYLNQSFLALQESLGIQNLP